MKLSRAVIVYSLLRIGMFAVIFALVFFLVADFVDSQLTAAVTAAFVAGIASMSLSYIVLRAPRERIATAIYEKRKGVPVAPSDGDIEDAAIDRAAEQK